jgi:formylglycine-generating enzyme required for sulfatase activity
MVGCRSKKCVYCSSGVLLPEYRLTEAEWEYAAAADVGRKYNIYKGQKNTLVWWIYTFR